MKQLIITIIFIIVVLDVVQSQSQIIYDEWGKPQPFSLNAPYYDEIRPDTLIPNYVTSAYDNDSLLWVYNNPDSIMLKRGVRCAMTIDKTHYSFKNMATHFDVEHGDIWILKFKSPTSVGLSVKFENFDLPEGASISSYRIKQTGSFIDYPFTYTIDNFVKYPFGARAFGKELYIEYYEPKSIICPVDIKIERIDYEFSDGRRIALPDSPKKKDEIVLKSGIWGWSTNADYCGIKMPCSETEDWETDGKSVAYMFIITNNGSSYYGTGFFINKEGGYSSSDNPYILTAGHFFASSSNVDLREDIAYSYVYVNYEDQTCDDSFERKGSLVGGFDILSVGSSFNTSGESGYVVNDDYALLQSTYSLSQLAVYNVLYAG